MSKSNTAFNVESSTCNSGYLMRSKNLVYLLASTDGWSLDRVIDWLFDEGQHAIWLWMPQSMFLHNLGILNQERQQQGKQEIRFGIGLHIGHVIYGNVGAPDRLDFTVMGAAMNRTARLEELTKEVGVPLLLSAEFAENTETAVQSVGKHTMRGVSEEQEVFSLLQGATPGND